MAIAKFAAIGAAIGLGFEGTRQGLAQIEGSQEGWNEERLVTSMVLGGVLAPLGVVMATSAPITTGLISVGLGAYATTTALLNYDRQERPLTSFFDVAAGSKSVGLGIAPTIIPITGLSTASRLPAFRPWRGRVLLDRTPIFTQKFDWTAAGQRVFLSIQFFYRCRSIC